jgi:hypothetical protein
MFGIRRLNFLYIIEFSKFSDLALGVKSTDSLEIDKPYILEFYYCLMTTVDIYFKDLSLIEFLKIQKYITFTEFE